MQWGWMTRLSRSPFARLLSKHSHLHPLILSGIGGNQHEKLYNQIKFNFLLGVDIFRETDFTCCYLTAGALRHLSHIREASTADPKRRISTKISNNYTNTSR